jgi:hypothetical protein
MLSNTQLNELAGLNAGRYPDFVTAEPYAGGAANPGGVLPPQYTTDGTDVSDVTLCQVGVELRQNPQYNAIRLQLDWINASSRTYAFTIGADVYSYAIAAATPNDAAAALVTEINLDFGGGAANLATTRSLVSTDGVILLWRPDAASVANPTSLTNVSDVDRDTDTCDVTVWGLPYGSSTWFVVGQLEALTITNNWTDLLRVSTLQRICIQVTGVTRSGDWPERVVVHVGPCRVEP